jgi:hypothetical protein
MAVVRRVGIFSVGKVMGVLYALMGLVIGGVFSLLSLLGAAARGLDGGIAAGLFGAGAIVVVPLFYGAIGFIAGIIFAALYNMIGSTVGGIEVEIVSD